jgi:hypothetical protein
MASGKVERVRWELGVVRMDGRAGEGTGRFMVDQGFLISELSIQNKLQNYLISRTH